LGRKDHQGRSELRKASRKRLEDAYALLEAGSEHAHCARFLGGYAVECKMKAIAMEAYGCWTLAKLAEKWKVDEQEVFTHGLERFAKRLPCYYRWRNSPAWSDFASKVNMWRPWWRYDPHDVSVGIAEAFLDAVERTLNWLEANQ
jgi:hypothetical protein